MTDQATDRAMAWKGHTPLPWKFHSTKPMTIKGNTHRVTDQEDYPTAFVPAWDEPKEGEVGAPEEAKANAALIVHRVNQGPAADAMAEALDALVKWRDRVQADDGIHYLNGERPPYGNGDDAWEHLDSLAVAARQALAAYRGQQ